MRANSPGERPQLEHLRNFGGKKAMDAPPTILLGDTSPFFSGISIVGIGRFTGGFRDFDPRQVSERPLELRSVRLCFGAAGGVDARLAPGAS